MTPALSPGLEAYIIKLCTRERITAQPLDNGAPTSLAELNRGILAIRVIDGIRFTIPVSKAYSDRTIWSSPRINWIARAWHDFIHYRLQLDFTTADELKVAKVQCLLVPFKYRKLLYAETAGQTLFHAQHGRFPTNQRVFVELCLARGIYNAIDLANPNYSPYNLS
jgi:hypothetical protein